jgi:ATP-dependent RNA helicase DeaD
MSYAQAESMTLARLILSPCIDTQVVYREKGKMMLFSELNLKESSLKAIEALGFEKPSEIQEKSIPILLEKDIDFIGQAQTGTGKTAAFALPLFEKIDFSSRDIQALILAPTRELANQICQEIDKLSKFEPVRTLAIYGGVPISNQMRDLRKNRPQIVVGTPGRMLDFIKRDGLRLEKVKYAILDEADEMLDMGFFDDVTEIVAKVPEKKIWMFSATMPKPIVNLINSQFLNPEMVKVTKKILTSESINQQFCVVRRHDMGEALCRYLDFHQNTYAIVFTRTKVKAKELTDELNLRGYPSDALHGDMSQDQRDLTMKKFKQKKISLLVCTDVAARGIDVTDLTHVINFSLPQDNESYVHRIGRTGRGGSKGIALSIIEPSEQRRVRDIERITQANIEKIKLPEVADVLNVLTEKAFAKFDTAIENFSAQEDKSYISFVENFSDRTKEEIMQAVYGFVFEQNLKRYQKARPLDVERSERPERGARSERSPRSSGTQAGYARFFVNAGEDSGMNPGALINFVARGIDVAGSEIGRIDIKPGFSFFEIPEGLTDKVLGLANTDFKNKKINIEVAAPRTGGESRGRRSGGGDRGGSRGGPRRAGGRGFSRGGDRDGNRVAGPSSRNSTRSSSRNFNS